MREGWRERERRGCYFSTGNLRAAPPRTPAPGHCVLLWRGRRRSTTTRSTSTAAEVMAAAYIVPVAGCNIIGNA